MGSLDTNSRENTRITLGLLEAVESGKARTQRGLAVDLGIALGLVNVYLKRCVKKGLVKVSQAPARRFAYYLTPQGFAEKSRLTAEFLSWSLTFFRQAKESCGRVFDQAHALGWRRIVLVGSGDLADIARICATDRGLVIVAIIDPKPTTSSAAGPPLLPDFDVVTMVHICEFFFPNTASAEYGGMDDRGVLDLFTGKTRSGGHILFYTKSIAFEKAKPIVAAWEKEAPVTRVGDFKTLAVYRKT